MSDWYAASLNECKAFLDSLDGGEVVVEPGDDIVAAMISMLEAAVVTDAAASHAASAVAALRHLGLQA